MTSRRIQLDTNVLNTVISYYNGKDVYLPDVDSWDTQDVTQIYIVMENELKRRYGQRKSDAQQTLH